MKSLCTLLATASVLSGMQLVMLNPSTFAKDNRTAIRAGETIFGEFRRSAPNVGEHGATVTNVDTYTFNANAGDRVSIRAFSNRNQVPAIIIPLITLTDPLGNPFAVNALAGTVVIPNVSTGGVWTVSLSSLNNVTGDYALSIEVMDASGSPVQGVNQPFGYEIDF